MSNRQKCNRFCHCRQGEIWGFDGVRGRAGVGGCPAAGVIGYVVIGKSHGYRR